MQIGPIETINIYQTNQYNMLVVLGLIGGAFYILIVIAGLIVRPMSELSFRSLAI